MEDWPAELVAVYKEYDRFTPIGQHENHHVPIANLSALLYNLNRAKNAAPRTFRDYLLYKPPEPSTHIDDIFLDPDAW